MKRLVVLFTLLAAAEIVAADPVTFTTVDGEKFERVQIVGQTPLEISVQTAFGVTRIAFARLSPEVRAQFGYDYAKAVAYYQALQAERARRVALEKSQATESAKALRTKREADLRSYEELDQEMREYQYLQENSGRMRTEALQNALRAKYLSGGK